MRSHRRLEERLDELQLASQGTDARAAAEVARDVAGFFARAVRRHEEDEEQSLFPRLPKSESLERLSREHREHEQLHAELEAIAEKLAGGGEALRDLSRVADALAQAYRTHIEEEENVLFPAARAALDDSAKAEIAREMQGRRGGGGGGRGGRRS